MSRIWEALKQAERQRSASRTSERGMIGANVRAPDDSDRRRDLRHAHSVPLLVYGSDAEKQPFHEQTDTINAHANGCLIALETAVSCGQRLFLTNTRNQAEQECRVVHIGKRVAGKAHVGVAFIAPAPEFWRLS
ncbi:MAG TPA: hypothetical protein VNM68_01870 [Candidatus Polarisedimenticolia bacterium]|nr:hypothetical protein [Candidatus Polarisedimenticolia bacterium]